MQVAGLNPDELQNLHRQGDFETRNQLANRASAVVTAEIKRLWKDRALKIRFNLDANHLDTIISDPTSTYDVEVNLNDLPGQAFSGSSPSTSRSQLTRTEAKRKTLCSCWMNQACICMRSLNQTFSPTSRWISRIR